MITMLTKVVNPPPFSNPDQSLVDAIRVLSILGSCVLVVLVMGVIWGFYRQNTANHLTHLSSIDNRIKLNTALLLYVLISFFTEVGRLGHVLTWRLMLTFVALGFGLAGTWSVLSEEIMNKAQIRKLQKEGDESSS